MIQGEKNFFLTLKAVEAAKIKLTQKGFAVLGFGAIEMAVRGGVTTVRPALIAVRNDEDILNPEKFSYMLFEESHILERDPKISYTDYVLLLDRRAGAEVSPLEITDSDQVSWVDWET